MNKLIMLSLALFIYSCSPTVPTCETCDFDCITDFDDSVISSQDCIKDHECSFELFNDTQIDSDEVNGMKSSQNSFVIKFAINTIDDPDISDDEVTTSFLLEIPNENESFSVNIDNLESIKPSMNRSCFCEFVGWKQANSGCIQGEKVDGTWHVQGDIYVDYYSNDSGLDFKFDFEVQ